jgi:EAL domain-containing protein (putative c-di-GMP-specific phosphodiesterase class I)
VQIDDFGTGYSSLGRLQRLPINTLKVDRSFVSKLGVGENSTGIVRTIILLAHDLGMEVIAEGIESEEQLAQLQDLECEYGQGYFWGKPLDNKATGALIAEWFATEFRRPGNSKTG